MFKPCPSYPGYSVSLNGDVRRESFTAIGKTGIERVKPATILSMVGRAGAKTHVVINGSWIKPQVLIEDAFNFADDLGDEWVTIPGAITVRLNRLI